MKHHLRLSLPLLYPLIAAFAAACSSSPGEPTGTGSSTGQTTGAAGTGGASTSTSAAGTGGGEIACKGSDYSDPTAPAVKIGAITVEIVDLVGKAAPDDVSVQVCGTNLCFFNEPPKNGMSLMGKFTVHGTTTPLQQPLFKFGDARHFAKLGIPVTAAILDAMGNTSFGTLTTAALPVDGAVFVAGKAATSGDVTLTVPSGGVFVIDETIYGDPIDQQLRTVTIPFEKATKVLAVAPPGIEQLYGVSPLETVFCPAASVTVINADLMKWPAGTDVEFWILGLDGASQEWAPYGGWLKVSDGKVSADGKTISTTAGLPLLSTFGIRKKP